MIIYQFVEWGALGVGLIGTLLWSQNIYPLAVSILWLLSSVGWVIFAYIYKHDALALRDLISIMLYANGIRVYFKANESTHNV